MPVPARRLATAVALVIGGWVVAGQAAAASMVITQVNPPGPVLAGTQVTVNADGFPAGGTVTFDWSGTASPETPVADGSGSLVGEPITVPLALDPGSYDLIACSPAPTCSAPYAMVVGPVLSTSDPQPVHRGATITVTVAGLQAGSTAISGWNGALSAATAQLVPDQPSFDIATTVPAGAPASSHFQVCQQQSGTTCTSTVRTLGTLDLTVFVPPPPSPTPSPPPVVPSVSHAPATPSPQASATPSASRSATPVLIGLPLGGVTPSPTPSAYNPLPVTAAPPPVASPAVQGPQAAALAPLFTPKAIVHLEVAAFAILSLLGSGAMLRGIAGLALPGAPAAVAAEAAAGAGAARRGGSVGSAKVKALKRGDAELARGDRSRTWRWPGTPRLDAVSLALPVGVAPGSPLLARLLIDASYLRAMLGSASLLLPVGGVLLGAVAVSDTDGQALPPTLSLLVALAVLGVVDALAGFLAASAFVVGVAVSGGVGTAKDVRTMLGLGVVWFAVPLIAAAARPLRRTPPRTVADRRKRIADVVIASLIGAWAIQKMTRGLPGLAEQPLSVSTHATALALIVLGASAVRIVLEEVAARRYPQRLAMVQPGVVPRPGTAQRIAACCLRTAVFVFVVSAFLGQHWQLWAGGALFLAPQLLAVYEDRFPNSEGLYRFLPRGLLKLVVMLFVGTWIGALVLRAVGHSADAALNAFVLLAAWSLVLSLVEVFGREGKDPEEGWGRWLAGAGVLTVGVLFVLGYVS